MNDVEDLLREELSARVEAAEAARASSALRLADLEARIGRVRLRRRWAGAGLSAVAVAAAIALPLTLLSPVAGSRVGPAMPGPATPGPAVPLTDTGVTPAGWAPVAFGNVQISVPADWQVTGRPVCGRAGHGYVVVGTTATSLAVSNRRCKQSANAAAIQVLPKGQGHTRRRTGHINGIPLLGVRPAARGWETFLAPTLHVLISARGPLADTVLGTLTRSPLSVVLARGQRFPVPRSWGWHTFMGVTFAAPGSWALVRNGHWGCPYAMATATVVLIPARNQQRPRCAARLDIAGEAAPRAGVIAGAGPDRAALSACDGFRSLHGLDACYQTPPFSGPVLDVAVLVPGRRRTTLIEIGLAGDGRIARTIFESIRPAS